MKQKAFSIIFKGLSVAKCIRPQSAPLTIVNSLKSVGIVTESSVIIMTLTNTVIIGIKELDNWKEECRQTKVNQL